MGKEQKELRGKEKVPSRTQRIERERGRRDAKPGGPAAKPSAKVTKNLGNEKQKRW